MPKKSAWCRLLGGPNLSKWIQLILGLCLFERILLEMWLFRWKNNFSASNFTQYVLFCVEVTILHLRLYFPIAMKKNGLRLSTAVSLILSPQDTHYYQQKGVAPRQNKVAPSELNWIIPFHLLPYEVIRPSALKL